MDDANCFHMIRLELKTSVNDMNVTVVSTVTSCDVTTVQQHYNRSTSSFPGVFFSQQWFQDWRILANQMGFWGRQ